MRTQRLHLEFAPNPRRGSSIALLMLLVAGAAVTAGAVELAKVAAGNAQLADTLAAVDARRGTAVVSTSRPAKPDPTEMARTRVVRQVSQNLMTPWADLLESLESVPIRTVAVLSIEPSVSKRSIRITAEAKTALDMLAYLGALQREPRLSSVVLVSHQAQLQSPGAPVRFQIHAAWGAGQ
jgi:Tfp pilus assembly protein PilN